MSIANSQAQHHDGRIGSATLFLALMMRRDSSVLAYLRTPEEIEDLTTAAWQLAER
ncbi:hypothetical protein FHR72_000956 [Mycolicibacterium iranicum]|uniref:Uncharacterized protein n=1 Tax=Mycolicibacterium iranicum TaxID=912594 RepID=A0A839Q243_MYCIR|nr:hypothetical protein [Mycolicibacterium iranicum]MBB2989493.1 hypothetical protein [Mycolicibacterium iranicum]